MTTAPAISVSGLAKAYRMWDTAGARLTSPLLESAGRRLGLPSLTARASRSYRDFWALRDVSFDVARGECFGVLGRNGSGKSTLLQIIAGTLRPSAGEVVAHGRIAAMLELGSGFNPEFTGRENVYLNAAIVGLSRSDVDARFDAIAGFADIGPFLDQPVRTYSSGMLMRLAFAVQTAVDPDVLIVDEALAVGDAPFQAKCFARLRQLMESGVTVLLVSHDMAAIRALCRRALCLSGGQVCSLGSAKQVCDDYQLLCMREQGILRADGSPDAVSPAAHPGPGADLPRNPEFARHAAQKRSGTARVRFIDCYFADANGRLVNTVGYNEAIQICWLVEATQAIRVEISLGVTVKTLKGIEVMSGTDKSSDLVLDLVPGQRAAISMPYAFPLRGEHYYLSVSLFAFSPGRKFVNHTINFSESELLDLVEYAYHFEVGWDRRWSHYGPVQIDSTLSLRPLASDRPTS